MALKAFIACMYAWIFVDPENEEQLSSWLHQLKYVALLYMPTQGYFDISTLVKDVKYILIHQSRDIVYISISYRDISRAVFLPSSPSPVTIGDMHARFSPAVRQESSRLIFSLQVTWIRAISRYAQPGSKVCPRQGRHNNKIGFIEV